MVTKKIFSNTTVAASGASYSEVQDMDTVRSGMVSAEGFGAIQYAASGSGTLTVTPQFSNDPTVGWIDGTAVTLTASPNAGATVAILPYRYVRFKLAETGGSASGTATVTVNIA